MAHEFDAIYAWDRQEPSWGYARMAVPTDLVADLIDVLRGHLASFEWPQGTSEEARAYFRLMDATSTTLGGLLRSHAARERHDGAYDLLLVLQSFLTGPRAADHLDAIRGWSDIDPDVVDALKALHWQVQKRRMEQAAMPRRPEGTNSGEGGTAAGGQ
jgi:hypothetical protein